MTLPEMETLEEWIHLGGSPEEIERRARIAEGKFVDAPQPEREVWEIVKSAGAAQRADARAPQSAPAPPTWPPRRRVSTWELISKSSPAYRRGSRHDGTLERMECIRERARGSPFFEDDEPEVERPRSRADLAQRLRQLAERKRKREDG